MPKRKRDPEPSDSSSENEIENQSLRIRASRLRVKTEAGKKKLHDALKLARGFERQKLGRRQKTASRPRNEKELERLTGEVAALKALDLTQTAERYLLKQFVKTKRINESPAFGVLYGKNVKVEGPAFGAPANVSGRLFNSNPVKQVMPGIMSGVLGCLGLEDYSTLKPSRSDMVKPEHPIIANGHVWDGEATDDEDEFRGFSPDEQPHTQDSAESENDMSDIDAMDLDQFDARLASSSDSDSDDPSDNFIPSIEVPHKPNGTTITGTEPYSKSRDLSLSPSPSVSSSASSSPPPTKSKPKPTKTSTPYQPPSSTTFLPSLMMGGYLSGSESDDVDDAAYNNTAVLEPRKNRRGQRARQLIAQRKYGKEAKHLQKMREQEGWDSKRGAVGSDEKRAKDRFNKRVLKDKSSRAGGGKDIRRGKPMGRGPQTSGANDEGLGKLRKFTHSGARPGDGGVQPGKGKVGDDKPLHPSWAAAKRRKEEKVGGKFEGRKTTFD